VIAYSILKTGLPYQEPGSDYFDRLHPERLGWCDDKMQTEPLQTLRQPLTPTLKEG
jgi:hypothetical protein